MEHLADTSSTRHIGISGVTFYVSRIKNTGVYFPGLECFIRNRYIYSCMTEVNTCVLEAILIANNPEKYKDLKGRKH
jgi:hypothetical protein